jgi:hypothetical protein
MRFSTWLKFLHEKMRGMPRMQRRKRARTQRCECNGIRDAAISAFLKGVMPTDGTLRETAN